MNRPEQSILGEFSSEQFFEEYWQKKPCLLKQALPDYRCPISPEALAGLACDDSTLSRLVVKNHSKNNSWQVEYGPFSESRFSQLPDSHWTLLVSHVEQYVPEINSLLSKFNFLPAWRLDDVMISYATDQGSVGPHLDSYDVFLLQGLGQRRWQINCNDYDESHFIPGNELRIIDNFNAEDEWLLSPGDILYLPPGVAHYGVAEKSCMTLSIGFLAPLGSELIQHYLNDVIEHTTKDIRYTDKERTPQKNPGEITIADQMRIQELMQANLSDKSAINHWFGKFITESTAAIEPKTRELTNDEFSQLFSDKKILYRIHGIRCAYLENPDSIMLFIHGEEISLSPDYLTIVRLITESTVVNLQTVFNHPDSSLFLELLNRLYNNGYYFFEDE